MDFRVVNITIDGMKDERHLYPLGDIHEGSIGCNRAMVKRAVKIIDEDDQAIWIGTGDYAEFINKSDPRFDPLSVDPSYRIPDLADLGNIQVNKVCDMLNPIKEKCLGMVKGNHESKISKHYDMDVMKKFKERLGVPVFNYSVYMALQFRRKRAHTHGPSRVRLYVHHGYGGGRLTGGKLNKVMGLHQIADAEVYMMGHVHDTAFTPKTKFDITPRGHLIERDIIYALVGAHLRTYVPSPGQVYGEEKAYSPTPHGMEKITISFQTKKGAEIPRCAYSWVPL